MGLSDTVTIHWHWIFWYGNQQQDLCFKQGPLLFILFAWQIGLPIIFFITLGILLFFRKPVVPLEFSVSYLKFDTASKCWSVVRGLFAGGCPQCVLRPFSRDGSLSRLGSSRTIRFLLRAYAKVYHGGVSGDQNQNSKEAETQEKGSSAERAAWSSCCFYNPCLSKSCGFSMRLYGMLHKHVAGMLNGSESVSRV